MKKEQYISIKNLIWKIVFAWRWLLATVIIGSIMLPTLKYVYDVSQYREDLLKEQVDEKFSDEELIQIQKYLNQYDAYMKVVNYKNYSFYGITDSLNSYISELEFRVSNQNEGIENTTTVCIDYFNSGKFANDIVSTMNIETEEQDKYIAFIKDIVIASCGMTESGDERLWLKIMYERDGTIGDTGVLYTDVIDSAKDYVLTNENIVLEGENTSKMDPTFIRSINLEANTLISEGQHEIPSLKEQMNYAQKKYVEHYLAEKYGFEYEDTESVIKQPTLSVKMVVLGFFLGLVLVCGVLFVKVLFANKLQEIDEITDLYDIKVLGFIHWEKTNKKMNVIDKWLYEMYQRSIFNSYKTIDVMVANIQVACKKVNTKKVYLTGSIDWSIIKNSDEYQKLIDNICELGIDITEGESILTNAQAYKMMSEVGAVVFVEGVEKSLYKDIEEQFTRAQDANVEIVGCIVME